MRRFVNPGKRIASFTRTFARMRWALNFDGVGVRGVLANRAINIDGDNTFEFYSSNPGIATIISQSISAVSTSREFQLYNDANALVLNFGGSVLPLCTEAQGFEPNKKYWLTLIGNIYSLYKNSPTNLLISSGFNRGAAREPTAVTLIGCRGNNAGAFSVYFQGIQRDIKINGIRWPMADRNQDIQLPSPTGLGAELFANPSFSNNASGWTLAGVTADLSGNSLTLTNTTASAGRISQVIPTQVGVKYAIKVTRISNNGIACRISVNDGATASYTGSIANRNIATSEVGQNIFMEFTAAGIMTAIAFIVNSSSISDSIVIEKVEAKPLGTCNPMTITGANNTNWVEQSI